MKLDITWLDFIQLAIALIVLFWVLKFLATVAAQLLKRNRFKRQIKSGIVVVMELYKPLALFTMIAAFVIIDYRIHGILVLAASIVLFKHIRNYCSGIFFKINPLVDVGVNLVTGEDQGEIERLLPFGIIMKVEHGERFINYNTLDHQGFYVNQKVDGSMRKTLYLLEPDKTEAVMDALFENPMVNFNQKPSVWRLPGDTVQQLQLTLEKGANIEAIIAYLDSYNIKTSLTKN